MGEKRGWRRRLLGKERREEVSRCSTYLHHFSRVGLELLLVPVMICTARCTICSRGQITSWISG